MQLRARVIRFHRFVDHLSQLLYRGKDALHWMLHPQMYQLVDDQGRPFQLDFVGSASGYQARRNKRLYFSQTARRRA